MDNAKQIRGIVIKGRGEGKKLGFPTANIELGREYDPGIFRAKAICDGVAYSSAVYIPENSKTLEAHLLDFEGDLYGKEIAVEIIEKIRHSMPYTTDEAMARQITSDIEEIRKRA